MFSSVIASYIQGIRCVAVSLHLTLSEQKQDNSSKNQIVIKYPATDNYEAVYSVDCSFQGIQDI